MNKTITVSIRLTETEHKKLIDIAANRGYPWTITSVIKAAIKEIEK